jgi:hypothetical protein
VSTSRAAIVFLGPRSGPALNICVAKSRHAIRPVAFHSNASQLERLRRSEGNQQDRHQRGGAESESMAHRVFPQAICG